MGVSRAGAGKAAHAHCRPAPSGAASPRGRTSRRPGPRKPLFLAIGACDALVASQHGPWTPSNTLRLSPDQEGLHPVEGRYGEWRTLGHKRRWHPGWGWGAPGGAGWTRRRRGGPAPGSAPGTAPGSWEEAWLALTPPPTGPCGRGGFAEPSRLSEWALATTSLHLRACAATMARDTNFLETCGFLPALL